MLKKKKEWEVSAFLFRTNNSKSKFFKIIITLFQITVEIKIVENIHFIFLCKFLK